MNINDLIVVCVFYFILIGLWAFCCVIVWKIACRKYKKDEEEAKKIIEEWRIKYNLPKPPPTSEHY